MADDLKEKKERNYHPVSKFPKELMEEINYRLYLQSLQPPMTPEQSKASVYTYKDNKNRTRTQNDASRRANAVPFMTRTRDFLVVLIDMGLLPVPEKGEG